MANYIAAPPESPAEIDPAAFYKYVIAQQGAASIIAEPDADFSFSVAMGEPAMLTLKYIGTPPTTALFKDVVLKIFWRDQSPTTAHTITYKILAETPPARVVPNIMNPPSVNVPTGGGTDVTIPILPDIGYRTNLVSYSVSNLPSGWTVNTSTGAVFGPAPTADGFYVLTLRVNYVGRHYERYFVVVAGTGQGGGGGGTINTGTRSPKVFLDGDFTEAQVAGPAEWEIPFKADPTPYIYKLKYWQLRDNYVRPAVGSPGPLGGFYCGESTGSTKIIGGGVIEFERRFCLIPASRSEYETFVYGVHLQFYTLGVPNTCIDTFPLTLNSRVQYDYFMTNDPNQIDLPGAPQFVNTCLGILALNGASNQLLPPASGTPVDAREIQAEDASLKLWELNIFERRMRFVKPPTTLELLTS